MTSERQIAANRRNAQRSRGPRTPAGRRRVGRNALAHGLAISVLKDRSLAGEVESLARTLAGTKTEGPLLKYARMVIEAEFELSRIARARASLINAKIDAPPNPSIDAAAISLRSAESERGANVPGCGSSADCPSEPRKHLNVVGSAVLQVLPQLMKFDRYERRARSRQARAIQLLIAHKAAGTQM